MIEILVKQITKCNVTPLGNILSQSEAQHILSQSESQLIVFATAPLKDTVVSFPGELSQLSQSDPKQHAIQSASCSGPQEPLAVRKVTRATKHSKQHGRDGRFPLSILQGGF